MKWDAKVKWGLLSGALVSGALGAFLCWGDKTVEEGVIAPAISATPQSPAVESVPQNDLPKEVKPKTSLKTLPNKPPELPKELFPTIQVEKREFLEGVPASFSFPVLTSQEGVKESMWQGTHQAVLLRDDVAFAQFYRAASQEPHLFLAYWGLCMVDMGPEYEPLYQKALTYVKERVEKGDLLPEEKALGACCLAWDSGKGRDEAAAPLLSYMEKHKAHLFVRLMAALFLREGYDESGKAKAGQEKAISLLEEALTTNPENHALLYTRAFLEETAPTPSSRALECAQKAAQLASKNPSSQHLLGHFLYRNGQYAEAQKCFETSLNLLDSTRNPLSVTLAGDSEWLKAFLYKTACLEAQGQHEEAFGEALKLSSLPWDEKRACSKGSLLQLWECSSLAARLALAFEGGEVAQKAWLSLPEKVREPLKGEKPSLVDQYLRVLATYWQGRKALLKKGGEKDKSLALFFEARDDFKGGASLAYQTGQASQWTRADELCTFLENDMQARLSAFAPESQEGGAWREKAVRGQRYASLLFPPVLSFGAEKVAARAALLAGQPAEAQKWLELGQKRFPHHVAWSGFSLSSEGVLVFSEKTPEYVLLQKAKETATPTPRPSSSKQASSSEPKRRSSASRSTSKKKKSRR